MPKKADFRALHQKPSTLAEAMAVLEKGLAEYFEQEGIE